MACEVAAGLGVPLDVFPVGTGRAVIRHVTHEEGGGKRCHQRVYAEGRPTPDLAGRTVILIDDGSASGTVMRDAIEALRRARPARLVAAVAAASETTRERLRHQADEVVCAMTTEPSTRGDVHVGLVVFER